MHFLVGAYEGEARSRNAQFVDGAVVRSAIPVATHDKQVNGTRHA
jgi:hypothetical protein